MAQRVTHIDEARQRRAERNREPVRVEVTIQLEPDPDRLVVNAVQLQDVREDRVVSTAALAAALLRLPLYGYTVRK